MLFVFCCRHCGAGLSVRDPSGCAVGHTHHCYHNNAQSSLHNKVNKSTTNIISTVHTPAW